MLKAIKRSKVFLDKKFSKIAFKILFFSWCMHLLQTFILLWFFPKVQIASLHICLKCLESDLEKFNMYSIFSPGNIGVCLGLYPGLGENMKKIETSLNCTSLSFHIFFYFFPAAMAILSWNSLQKKVTLAISTFGLETLTFHFLETNKALRYVYF